MNKLEKMFEKYAEEDENMDAIEAVRLLVRAYINRCKKIPVSQKRI